MLVEFSVENFLSFRERVTLSMVAANGDRSLTDNTIETAPGAKFRLLRSVALYGANASGKSNLYHAIDFMNWFVGKSATTGAGGGKTGVIPFKLDGRNRSKPSTFEVVFILDGVRYVYGFSVDAERVHEEWLSSYPHGQQRVLFHRSPSQDTDQSDYYFGPNWGGRKKHLTELTRPNALMLSVAAQFNHETAQSVVRWFSESIRTVSCFPVGRAEQHFTSKTACDDPRSQAEILWYWQKADPSIKDFTVKKTPVEDSQELSSLPEMARKELSTQLPEGAMALDVHTTREAIDADGNRTEESFDFSEESDGTQKLFALAGPWRYVLENGCVTVVDELDARLHPALTRWLIQLFHNPKTNPRGAQLIFTTHNAELLDHRSQEQALLRRDQVWLVEKDAHGGTALYSLWDFKKPPRRDENIRLGYLAGRYGAVPFIEDTAEIAESAVE